MTDRRVIYTVTLALAAIVVGAVLAASLLAAIDKVVPDLVADMAKVSLGALGSLLASTRASDGPPQAVQVVNETRDPVPVEPAPVKKAAKK